MPRDGSGNFTPASPPAPYVPGSLAKAEDINASLSDIATALTQSLNTAGTAPSTGDQNLNGHSLSGVNNLGVTGTATIATLNVTGPSTHTGVATFTAAPTLTAGATLPNNVFLNGNATPSGSSQLIGMTPVNEVQLGQNTYGPVRVAAYLGMTPAVGSSVDLGDGGHLWNNVWAVNGVIQTSDVRLKTDIRELPECRGLVDAIRPICFRWQEGPDMHTEHFGFSGQQVAAAIPGFGGVVEPADGPICIRPHEMIAVLWGANRELSAEVKELRARVAELEGSLTAVRAHG